MTDILRVKCNYCEEITLHINGECSVCGDFYTGSSKQKIKKKKDIDTDVIEKDQKYAVRQ